MRTWFDEGHSARYCQNSNFVASMSLKIVTFKKGKVLYRQAHTLVEASKKQMLREEFVWFALVPNYGVFYGDIHRRYKLTRPLRLLDISTMAMRQVIALQLGVSLFSINPNDQYEGDRGNLLAHQVFEPLLQAYGLDGTIIEDARADEECQGPTEVVLRGSSVRHIQRIF